jgi:hypothetical protein
VPSQNQQSSATHDDVIIPAPRIEPFTQLRKIGCQQCGTKPPNLLARIYCIIVGNEPGIHNVSYCAGGLAPVEDIRNPIEAMMRGRSESRPRCGGVVEQHLHLSCRCCGFTRLMRTKPLWTC